MLVLLSACGGPDGDGDPVLAAQLERRFQVAHDEGRPTDLRNSADGAWDRLVFVCPHENQSVVDDRLGFAWADFPGGDRSGGRALFVFASDEAVVNWTALARDLGDPCPALPGVLDRDEAVVGVDADRDGFLTLRPEG